MRADRAFAISDVDPIALWIASLLHRVCREHEREKGGQAGRFESSNFRRYPYNDGLRKLSFCGIRNRCMLAN